MDSLIRVEFQNGKLKNSSAFAVSKDEIASICVNFELDVITAIPLRLILENV